MKYIFILSGLLLGTNASAEAPEGKNKSKAKKMRLKFSTPIFVQNQSTAGDVTTSQSGATLFTLPARAELTYRIAPRFEIGGMFSFGGITTETDPSTVTFQRDESIMFLTGAYNFKLAQNIRGFLQPIVGMTYLNDKIGDSVDNVTQNILFGGDLGVRFKLTEGVQFDLATEFLTGNGSLTDKDSNTSTVTAQSFNLRAGLGARF